MCELYAHTLSAFLCSAVVLFPDKSLTVGFAVYAVNRSVGPLSVCIAVAVSSPNKSL